jgi:hypothetical protein
MNFVDHALQHGSPNATLPELGIDDQLRAGTFYLVSNVEVAVADDQTVDDGENRPDRLVAAVSQVQRDVLGQRPDPIDLGRFGYQVLNLAGLAAAKSAGHDHLQAHGLPHGSRA